jgi:hypothetical protein
MLYKCFSELYDNPWTASSEPSRAFTEPPPRNSCNMADRLEDTTKRRDFTSLQSRSTNNYRYYYYYYYWMLYSLLFSVSWSYTQSVGLTGWGISLYLHTGQNKQNRSTQTFMPQVGFEPRTAALERAKTVYASDREATAIKCETYVSKLYWEIRGWLGGVHEGCGFVECGTRFRAIWSPLLWTEAIGWHVFIYSRSPT